MIDQRQTDDDFLGGLLTLKQPKKGYRITGDSVYLAATVNLKNGERILDTAESCQGQSCLGPA